MLHQKGVASMSSMTSRAFNQETGTAKKQAFQGPVFITDRGSPTHVLLTMTDYEKLVSTKPSFLEMIAQKGDADFEFEIPKLSGPLIRDFEFD
jgi:hypothetical protein